MPETPPAVSVFDEDGALSREFLLGRGACCGSGCRNCPYNARPPEVRPPPTGKPAPPASARK